MDRVQPERNRRRRAGAAVAACGASGLVVGRAPDVRYLSGFTGSNGWLWLTPRGATLFTDGRYREQARQQCPGVDVVIASEALIGALAGHLEELSVDAKVLADADALSHAEWQRLERDLGGRSLVAAEPIVASLRECKDIAEQAAIEAALRLLETAFEEVCSRLRPGLTEREVAARLDYACARRGGSGMAFDTIVASGPNGALPHARPGDRQLTPGDVVVVDCGCVLDGYCSDMTRVLSIGPLGERWAEIHDAVDRARSAALACLEPGIDTRTVDAAARSVLAEAGLEEHFVHSLGHGVGLEVHEPPRLSSRSSEVLREGMVVTVEPGVYLPGEGGVRLEDLAVITADGARRLNRLDAAPVTVPAAD